VVACGDEKIQTAADVLAEQLRVIREADPDVSQTRAASMVGATRFQNDFQAAWELSGRVCVPLKGDTHNPRLVDGGGAS